MIGKRLISQMPTVPYDNMETTPRRSSRLAQKQRGDNFQESEDPPFSVFGERDRGRRGGGRGRGKGKVSLNKEAASRLVQWEINSAERHNSISRFLLIVIILRNCKCRRPAPGRKRRHYRE